MRLTVKTNHNTRHHDHQEYQAEKVFSRHFSLGFAAIPVCRGPGLLLSTSAGLGLEVEDAVRRERGRQGTSQDGAEGSAWSEGGKYRTFT